LEAGANINKSAADFQMLFRSGLRVTGLTTTRCQSVGKSDTRSKLNTATAAIRIRCWCFDRTGAAISRFVRRQWLGMDDGVS
jgi:hypothetical protein